MTVNLTALELPPRSSFLSKSMLSLEILAMVAYLNLLRPGLPREVLGYLNCDFRCLAE
jgi:hypothetical protein